MAGFFQANFWNSDGTSSLGIYHESGTSHTIQDAVDWAETQSWYPAGAQWSLSIGGPVADYSQQIGDDLDPTGLYQYVEPDYIDHFYLDGDRYNIKAANGVVTSSIAPSNPTEGMLWYDTTNDVLKVYDGSNWNATGATYTAGTNVQISPQNVISATDTTYNAGNGIEIGTIHRDTQGPCSDGFHIPTHSEWGDLVSAMTSILGTPTASNYQTYLKMPFSGCLPPTGMTIANTQLRTSGRYWSSTADNNGAYRLYINASTIDNSGQNGRSDAFSIRPFKNVPETPDNTWTNLYGTLTSGIYHNANDGLISIVNGATVITIADKNLGATDVCNNGDTLSPSNCGNLYQWGNNYAFPLLIVTTYSTTQVNASGYGPGNYYEDSTYIAVANDRSSVQNNNLWGGVTNGTWTSDSGTTIINTGVTSFNGQTGAVTYSAPVISVNGNTGAVTVNEPIVSSTTPANPTEGMLRYDTTNDQLKVYDGTNWNVTGKEYTAGNGINIGGLVADADYHIPTADEYSSLITLLSGMGVSTLADEYLKMPHAGYRDNTGSVVGTSSYMCLSTASSQGNTAAALLFLNQSTPSVTGMGKDYAKPMRLFKNTPVTPDSSWTHTYTYNTDYGIFHNTTLGLITVTNGTTLVTMKDKNEGATEVRNDGDTLSIANTGNTFQRGNYYPFPSTLDSTTTINTSAVSVDTTGYGEGVGYYDSTFRTIGSPYDWTDPVSTNLWTKGGNGMAWYTYSDNAITNTGVISVNGSTGAVTVNEFSPTGAGSAGQSLVKTSNGYDWEDKQTKIFDMPTDLTTAAALAVAQDAYDWYIAGNIPVLKRSADNSGKYNFHRLSRDSGSDIGFNVSTGRGSTATAPSHWMVIRHIVFSISSGTVTSVSQEYTDIYVSNTAPGAGTGNGYITLVI